MALSPQSESWCLTVSKLVLFGEGETLPWGRNSWGRASGTHRSSGKERLFPQALDLRLWVGWRPPDAVMQSESSRCEEEPPSLLWGLDPVFLAFAKLYIRDILDLKESRQVPGVFFYNGHPIKQVDILGTVIGVRERDAFYSYGVDDSTGVINCICWKKLNNTDSSSATAATNARELSLTSQLKKLQETIAQRLKIEIGDLVQIRGHIRTYREEREIHATVYHKVDDPVCNIQIARMLELPTIYRKVYDQPFHHPALEKEEALSSNPGALDLNSLTCLLSEKAKEFLVENRVQSFYQQELETVESLLSLAKQPVVHSTRPGQVDFKNDTTSKAIHSIFKNAIKLLQEKGFVFQKDRGFDNLFYVTREDKELHRKILQIIQEDCQKPNHVEKGCHFLHILACARLSLSPGLSEPVLRHVLELLEDQSDIVSTSENYYTTF
ncbi:CST complex subunit STN1 isoform X3 [Sus scrofa]|uniref:CST complex subunit STN1 isoform X3 n=1 Tax=Sus scrofa TaxID=9823 RepID=UPI0003AF23A3|nr:CST complex subunit STN1 isoform X3 [Sus scrofa]